MAMVVQHNLTAMNSNRMLGITTGQQAKSSEKLSSGYRINRAADDAAGLTISEKMRKQMRGLDRASTNAQDGISCVQTAEGALTEVHAMLQRMNELAVQSANGTNSEADRKAIQDEIAQLVTEIDRVSETTKFNETYLLKGGEGSKTETKETVNPAYKDTISTEKTLKFNAAGTTLYATKDGVNEAITDANFNDIFEIGTVTSVVTQDAADKVAAGDYTIVDVAKTDADGFLGMHTIANDKVEEDITYTWDSTNSVFTNDLNADTITKAELETKLGLNAGDITANAAMDGKTFSLKAATLTKTGDYYAENGTEALTDMDIIKAVANGDDLYTKAATTEETEGAKVMDGYQIYKVAPDETTDFGAQLNDKLATEADIAGIYTVESDLLQDAGGNAVSPDKLADYFEKDGKYKGGLYKDDGAGNLLEVGAEQIDDYVDSNRETVEVTTRNALELNLHVGADSEDTNKIKLTIKSMDATTLGLKENGKAIDLSTEETATNAIDTISNAIAEVSAQRSALGAIQNRLEHTIANLDNVVENTTAAESRIRDTDMAEEMVEYSKNNILAQAGQSMLAQANQSTQGVLSLLG